MTKPLPPNRLSEHVEKLRAFRAVALAGSITLAARQLRLSQAAVSHAVKVLEEITEVSLILRDSRGIRLTPAGKTLLEFSTHLILELEDLEAKLRSPSEKLTGRLRVATHETLAIHLWPDFIVSFLSKNPSVALSLFSSRVDPIIQGLLHGEYHVAVTVEPAPSPKLAIHELYRGRLKFYAAGTPSFAAFPELRKKTLALKEATRLPIFSDQSAHVAQYMPIPALLARHGFDLTTMHELTSFEASTQLASRGLGLALLPDRNAEPAVRQNLIRAVAVPELEAVGFGEYKICISYLLENQKDLAVVALHEAITQSPFFTDGRR